jgi:hypothetical protein
MEKTGKVQTLVVQGKNCSILGVRNDFSGGRAYLKPEQKGNKKPNLVKEVRLVNACIEQG